MGLPTSTVVGIAAGWVLAFLVLGIVGLLAMALVTVLTIKGAPARRAAFRARHAAVRAALAGHRPMAGAEAAAGTLPVDEARMAKE